MTLRILHNVQQQAALLNHRLALSTRVGSNPRILLSSPQSTTLVSPQVLLQHRLLSSVPEPRPAATVAATRWATSTLQPTFRTPKSEIGRVKSFCRQFSRSSRVLNRDGPQEYYPDSGQSPLGQMIVGTTKVIKNLLIFTTGGIALTYFVWSGTHAYLENYKCPSPPGTSSKVQNLLHGAWAREEYVPDPEVAELYLTSALQELEKDLKVYYAKVANGEQLLELDEAFVEVQNRLARFYARVEQDERAATIWTRLWKLTDRLSSNTSSTATSGRPQISKKQGIEFAKRAGECWMRLGEFELAKEALGWAIENQTAAAEAAASTTTNGSIPVSPELISLMALLGALYVREANHDYALSLFVRALKMVQSRPQESENETEGDMWHCREAILLNSIGETLYGSFVQSQPAAKEQLQQKNETKKSSGGFFGYFTGSPTSTPPVKAPSPELSQKEQEALGWMQKALEMAKTGSQKHRDCAECAGVVLNNLGLLSEGQQDLELANVQFEQAVSYATLAEDYAGLDDFSRNLKRVQLEQQVQKQQELGRSEGEQTNIQK